MEKTTNDSWKLIFATFVALGMTVLITVMVTLNWVGDDTDSVASLDDGEPVSATLQQPENVDTGDDRSAELYDLPDHCGQLVADVDGERVTLPNMKMDYQVDIRGDLATVVLKQRFENRTSSTIEPVYEFPLHEQAAVYAMSMEIGGKRVDAEIKRKEEAREIYEEARAQGRQAALLEQDRPNLFVQRVANVEPGQEVEITLRYTHALPKDRGAYHLAIPLVVTERFTPELSNNLLVPSDGAADPGASPGGASNSTPEQMSLTVRIDGGMPVTSIQSPSHPMEVSQFSESVFRAELNADKDTTRRHFRMSYRLSGDQTQVGVNSYWDRAKDAEHKGYFDLLIEPPSSVAAAQIPNREMVFVVDNSGSMHSGRMKAANDFVIKALDHLRPDDHFRIIIFNSNMTQYSPEPMPATPANVEAAQSYMSRVTRQGGTQMVEPLRAALSEPAIADTMRLVVVVTDVAVSNDFEVISTIREEVGDARLFGLGIGGEVNRYLLEEIGRAGRGFSAQFDMDDNVNRVIDDFVRRLQSPVLTDITIDWGTLDTSSITPARSSDVFEGGSVRIHGKYANPGPHTIKVSGILGGEPVVFETEAQFTDSVHDGDAVKLAWARQKIRDEMHQLTTPERLRTEEVSEEELRERIISLGLAYSLTTQWTSFVAVGEEAAPARREVQDTRIIGHLGARSGSSAGAAQGGGEQIEVINRRRSERVPAPRRMPRSAASAPEPGEAQGQREIVQLFDEAPPERAPKLTMGSPSVDGPLDSEIIQRVVRQHRRELLHCYEQELEKDDQLAGEVTVGWSITADGNVENTTIKESSMNNQPVESCITRRIGRWVFPPGESAVEVEYPFIFDSDEIARLD